MKIKIVCDGYRCLRCGWEWIPRIKVEVMPKTCPKCKSPYWDSESTKKAKDE